MKEIEYFFLRDMKRFKKKIKLKENHLFFINKIFLFPLPLYHTIPLFRLPLYHTVPLFPLPLYHNIHTNLKLVLKKNLLIKKEKQKLHNGWSFRWVKNQSSQKMINFANPGLKLPSRKVLAGRILNTNSEHIKKSLIDTAQKDELGVTVCFDGWKNVKKQEIMESVLITSVKVRLGLV
ncbi:unnamed protein product [Rhizophagus irregularis]|nr:unnamed protein product [Rhizophagus irregularis]CAB4430176.1 unnamed protein product [Rhizophagus irregularis]